MEQLTMKSSCKCCFPVDSFICGICQCTYHVLVIGGSGVKKWVQAIHKLLRQPIGQEVKKLNYNVRSAAR